VSQQGAHVVKTDLFHRERNVLVSLNFDLTFEISLGQARRHLDDLGNGRITADCYCDIGRFGTSAFDRTTNSLTDSLGINQLDR
jgi:hypothetical protein